MRVPVSWLREYVDIPTSPQELAHRLTMAGTEVRGITIFGGEWENVYVGQVISVDPHPNADRLKLATVDLDGERWTVVCGAPNIAAGQKVPFAKVGARLVAPQTGQVFQLRAARIRGVRSEGMVCSERELGLGEDDTGIMVLAPDAPAGRPLAHYLGDAVLDLDVTPNRPDCLSVLGVAHEVAALTGGAVREPERTYPEEGPPIDSQVTVTVEDPGLCFRYTASLIMDIRVGPSPPWLQDRLLKAGQRPINNVVDVTNYVMLEYGQPQHAFDYFTLAERRILVRPARSQEVLVALDGEERTLQPPMLVIADAQQAVGLAGIIGGAESEMTEGTTAVLLESATFDPVNTRRTATALRVRTEASARFEKGLDPELSERALRRATRLILEVAGGKACKGIVDVYPGRRERKAIRLRQKRVKQVLGADFSLEQMTQVLTSLGFRCQQATEGAEGIGGIIEVVAARPAQRDGALLVTPPYWRVDVTLEDDLVEEVARIVGYESIPTTALSGGIPSYRPQRVRELRERVKDLLVGCGMQETISYSLVSRAALDKADALKQGPGPLRVANPMSAEQEYLRTTLRASILSTLAANQRQASEGLRLFEAGRVYLPRERDLPLEKEMAVGVFCGPRSPTSWLAEPGTMDFFDAKGTLETLLARLGVQAHLRPHRDPLLHPARCAQVVAGGRALGVVGELHPRVRERFDITAPRVALFELDLEALLAAQSAQAQRYEPLTRFPGAVRDVALVVDQQVPAGAIQSIIQRHPLVTQASLFDVYVGKGVPAGKRSLAYRITFQSPQVTLTNEQVNQAQREILETLGHEVGATLRV